MKTNFEKIAIKVSIVSILSNTILSLLKLFAGLVAHSSAMVSDAIHSASDVFSSFIVIVGVKLSSKDSDKEHPYGHERLECVAAIVLAMILFMTGFFIGLEAIETLIEGKWKNIEIPGVLALIAAIVSILTKEGMYWYTRYYALKINSSALMADAWHHRSDSLSSIGALIGIAGTRMGLLWLDTVSSLVICGFIGKAAYEIFMDAIEKMVDHACDEETEEKIRQCVLKKEDVKGIQKLKTRVFGNKIYVDLVVLADGNLSLKDSNAIAEEIHDTIEKQFENVKHINVQVKPL